MKKNLLILTLLLLTITANAQISEAEFNEYDTRARELVSQMTLNEKVSLMYGHTDALKFPGVAGINRLGIPDFKSNQYSDRKTNY